MLPLGVWPAHRHRLDDQTGRRRAVHAEAGRIMHTSCSAL